MKDPTVHPITRSGPRSPGPALLAPAPVKLSVVTAHPGREAETTCSTCDDDAAAELGYRLVLRCTVRS